MPPSTSPLPLVAAVGVGASLLALNLLLRPSAPAPEARAPEAAAPEAEAIQDAAPEDAAPEAEAIQDAARSLAPSIQACLSAWQAADPPPGELVIAFTLAPEGLREAVVQDHGALPEAVGACLVAAAYGVAWPRPSRGELTFRYPYRFLPVEGVQGEVPPDDEASR